MQDYYKILEMDYDATDDIIRSNYIRLALVCSAAMPSFRLLSFYLLDFELNVGSSWVGLGLTLV